MKCIVGKTSFCLENEFDIQQIIGITLNSCLQPIRATDTLSVERGSISLTEVPILCSMVATLRVVAAAGQKGRGGKRAKRRMDGGERRKIDFRL